MDKIQRYKGQADIVDEKLLDIPIHLIGCGGIGSWTALILAKMGCNNITVYDFDEIEEHNVASQFYEDTQLGELKTEALVSNVCKQSSIAMKIGEVEEEKDINEGIVIIAIDSMAGRLELNEYFKNKDLMIIDARMGGLQAEFYCCKSKDYEPTLVAPDEAQHERCTEKAISFNCAFIGSMICNAVRLYVNDKLDLEEYKERTFLFDGLYMINPNLKPRKDRTVEVDEVKDDIVEEV